DEELPLLLELVAHLGQVPGGCPLGGGGHPVGGARLLVVGEGRLHGRHPTDAPPLGPDGPRPARAYRRRRARMATSSESGEVAKSLAASRRDLHSTSGAMPGS